MTEIYRWQDELGKLEALYIELNQQLTVIADKMADALRLDEEADRSYDKLTPVNLATMQRDLADVLELAKCCNMPMTFMNAIKFRILPEEMEALGLTTMTIPKVGRVTVKETMSASQVAAKKVVLQKWLKDNDHSDLLKESINSSTLAAFCRERLKMTREETEEALAQGEDPFPWECVTLKTTVAASITKK